MLTMFEKCKIKKGDIIQVIDPVYIEYPGGKWGEHFTNKKRFALVITDPTNNGNFITQDTKGISRHRNIINENIIAIYPR